MIRETWFVTWPDMLGMRARVGPFFSEAARDAAAERLREAFARVRPQRGAITVRHWLDSHGECVLEVL